MKINTKFLLGVTVIVLGILLLLEQTAVIPSISRLIWEGIWKFWPLILIFLGTKLLTERNDIPGIFLLLLGTSILSSNLFNWNFFAIIWPVGLIAIGISILLGRDIKENVNVSQNESKEGYVSDTVVFWGVDRKITSKNFKGGEFNVAFGGLGLDLRDAKISKDGAKVHVNCAFGGVEIFVPKDCRVKTKGTGFFGAWEPKVEDRGIDTPVLEITGGVVFGGVEIK